MTDPLQPFRDVPRPATPGPWEADGFAVRRGLAPVLRCDSWLTDEEDQEQDARAIAYLPELLERYDRLVRAMDLARDCVVTVNHSADHDLETIDAILLGEA